MLVNDGAKITKKRLQMYGGVEIGFTAEKLSI